MGDTERPTSLALQSPVAHQGETVPRDIELDCISSSQCGANDQPQVLLQPLENSVIQDSSFVEVPLSDPLPSDKKKVPKRILYFSDGILEEYSSEEDNDVVKSSKIIKPSPDPKSLKWVPYFGHLASRAGNKMLSVADYVGESLAEVLGITTPKYQYEIDEHDRIKKEALKNPSSLYETSAQPVETAPISCDSLRHEEDTKTETVPKPTDSRMWERY